MTSRFSLLPARFSLLCTALLCALPFLQPYHLYPLTTFYSEWIAVVLGLGVMVVLLGRRAWAPAEAPWAALSPLALALLVLVHGLLGWSPYFGSALTATLYLIWASLLVVAARALVRECGGTLVFETIAAGIAAGALLSAWVGVIQHLRMPTLLDFLVARTTSSAIFGNLAQANHFASYTTLGLLSLAYLHARGRVGWVTVALGAAPMLFVLGVSGSRAAALYLLAAFSIAAWLQWRVAEAAVRCLLLITGLYLAIYFLMQIAVDAGPLHAGPGYTVTAFERLSTGTASLYERLRLWRAAWAVALAHPWFGTGWGTFATGHFEMAAELYPQGGYQLYHHAHNIVSHLLAETGLTGLACVMLPLLMGLRRGDVPAAPRVDCWLLLALGAVLGLHSLLEYPLWYAYFLGIAALLLGAAPLRVHALRFSPYWRWIVLAVLGFSLFNLDRLWTDYRRLEDIFLTGPAQPDRHQLPGLMMRLHQNPLLRPYVEVSTAIPMTLDEASLDRQLYVNTRALRYVPEASLVYRQVLLLALADRLPEAQRLLTQARHAYPAAPAAFERDLQRLVREQPVRFRPLLESGLR